MYTVINPATGATTGGRPAATDAEIRTVVDSAVGVARTWGRATSARDRVVLLGRVAALHTERRDELAHLAHIEMGKSIEDALGEVDFAAAIYQFYADNAEGFLADENIDVGDAGGTAVVRRMPVGALLGIMPWNFPYYQVARFAGPNLAVGNTIILKPAPQCPTSAAAQEQIFRDAGFPEGAYVTAYATNEQIETIIADPGVAGVSLTGSERAGAAVAEIAGRNLKKVVLELGGSDPFVLLSTNDLDAVVESAVAARLDNAGQACNAAKRFVVIEDLYEPFVEKVTAALLASGDIAPLSSVGAAENLSAQVASAVAAGAHFVSAGPTTGAYAKPGVLTGVTSENPVYGQELFGPVAMVFKVGSEAEAIQVANDTSFGLGSYVFTTDAAQGARVADQIEAGMVYINGVLMDLAETPFGGVKRSGFGRELGRFGMDEFANKKLIRTAG